MDISVWDQEVIIIPSVLGVEHFFKQYFYWFMYCNILRILADNLSASDHETHENCRV